ncbi:uncharacterized protein EI90DRAFT_3017478 [Cantharellus anzutake]|uniref:uncharacterized protein n=1 Tax=Cantharellus anzutake TaxID=1750568 RepID=UPI0019067EA4|nr:uncharacterized protein EI90DRAFT_3017478 [Cantharellus anzutake]KAF8328867.1 hypothetical protein EI90DRAFT_3017478 [Cantharellus anzutake]
MASTILSTQTTHTPGILINAVPRHYAASLARALSQPTSPSNGIHSLLTSSASSTSSSSASLKLFDTVPSPSGRKIRFAPLPDPRKLEEEDDAIGSDTSLSDEGSPNGIAAREGRGANGELEGGSGGGGGKLSLWSSLEIPCKNEDAGTASAAVAGPSHLSGGATGHLTLSSSPTKSSFTKSAAWKLIKPFIPGISSKTKPESKEPYPPLFRETSSDSIYSTQSLGLPSRSRRLSTSSSTMDASSSGSITSQERAAILSHTTPLRQTVSEGGRPRTSSAVPSSKPNGIGGGRRPLSATANARTRRPLFMLNGRVYGKKRGALTPDPFQHQRAFEPEFSEWGTGGLGSVPSNRASGAAADWDRLHNGKSFAKAHDDDDDGGGMGWVKRRREARAKAAAEAEAAAAAAAITADAAEASTGDADGGSREGQFSEGKTDTAVEGSVVGTPAEPQSQPTQQLPPASAPAQQRRPTRRRSSGDRTASIGTVTDTPQLNAGDMNAKTILSSALSSQAHVSYPTQPLSQPSLSSLHPQTSSVPPTPSSHYFPHQPLTRTPSNSTQKTTDRHLLEHRNTSVHVLPPSPPVSLGGEGQYHHQYFGIGVGMGHQRKHSLTRLNISRVSSHDSGTVRGTSGTVTPTIGAGGREILEQISAGITSEEVSEESDSEEDEDDEDEAEMERARKTAACAGVEKISRHREHNEE